MRIPKEKIQRTKSMYGRRTTPTSAKKVPLVVPRSIKVGKF